MFKLDKIVEICAKHNITVEEFFILECVYKEKFSLLEEYCKENDITHSVENLAEKEYLEGDAVRELELLPKFFDEVYIDSNTAGKEFFRAYPSLIEVNGRQIASKSCNREYYLEKYGELIGNDRAYHVKIIKGLKIARGKGLITNAIRKFIDGEMMDLCIEVLESETTEGTRKTL